MSINLPVHAVLALVLLAVVVVPSSAVNATTDWSEPGNSGVETRLADWIDTARDRSLPIKLYLPEGDGPFPVVIFSHGLGGSREAAPYLGEYWASHGFLGVFVQHPGTDRSLFAGATSREEILEDLRSGTRNREMAQARFEDIPFVIDEIERLAAMDALPADITRIGMAGHSYGAATTIAVMGRRFGRQMDFSEPRILAGLALSPTAPPARLPERMHPRLYDRMSRPMLHLTGTEDVAAIRPETDPADRTIPFNLIPSGEQYLVVFDGGDHAVFGGRRGMRNGTAPDWYPAVQAITAQVSTAFWQAHLNGDQDAMTWLNGSGLSDAVRESDRVERRNLD